MAMDSLVENVRKEVASIMCTYDVVLCGGNEADMTDYLESRRKNTISEGMRVNRPKAQWMRRRRRKKKKVYLLMAYTNTVHVQFSKIKQ